MYLINPQIILFAGEIKGLPCFSAYNRNTKKIVEIDYFGYEVLKIVDKSSGSIFDSILQQAVREGILSSQQSETKLKNFLDRMVEEKVLFQS